MPFPLVNIDGSGAVDHQTVTCSDISARDAPMDRQLADLCSREASTGFGQTSGLATQKSPANRTVWRWQGAGPV